jgi:hypothetical protein
MADHGLRKGLTTNTVSTAIHQPPFGRDGAEIDGQAIDPIQCEDAIISVLVVSALLLTAEKNSFEQ